VAELTLSFPKADLLQLLRNGLQGLLPPTREYLLAQTKGQPQRMALTYSVPDGAFVHLGAGAALGLDLSLGAPSADWVMTRFRPPVPMPDTLLGMLSVSGTEHLSENLEVQSCEPYSETVHARIL